MTESEVKRAHIEKSTIPNYELILNSGERVNFHYQGYSQLFDELEPDINTPIEIIEPLTIEQYIIGLSEYRKFVAFKDCINNILNYHFYWKLNCINLRDIQDIASFNIDDPFLNWLMIYLPKSEKDYIKALFKDNELKDEEKEYIKSKSVKLPFSFNEIMFMDDFYEEMVSKTYCDELVLHSDNPLLYFVKLLKNKINLNNLLRLACVNGHLKTILLLVNIDYKYDFNTIFNETCKYNQLDVVKNLLSTVKLSLNDIYDGLLRGIFNNNYELVKWLLENIENLINFYTNYNEYIIIYIIKSGNLELLKLLDLYNPLFNYESKFSIVCRYGQLEIAKWINDNKIINNYYKKRGFKEACINDHLDVAKWLINLDFEISDEEKHYVILSCFENKRGLLEMCKWLLTLEPIPNYLYLDSFFKRHLINNNLEMAQWIYSIGEPLHEINICNITGENLFYECLHNSSFEIIKWIYSIYPFNLNTHQGQEAFEWCCENRTLEIVSWLYSIHKFNTKNINFTNPIIGSWLLEINTFDL